MKEDATIAHEEVSVHNVGESTVAETRNSMALRESDAAFGSLGSAPETNFEDESAVTPRDAKRRQRLKQVPEETEAVSNQFDISTPNMQEEGGENENLPLIENQDVDPAEQEEEKEEANAESIATPRIGESATQGFNTGLGLQTPKSG